MTAYENPVFHHIQGRPKSLKKDDRTLSDILQSYGIRTERDHDTDIDGARSWFDRNGKPLGRFDVVEGWAIVEKNEW